MSMLHRRLLWVFGLIIAFIIAVPAQAQTYFTNCKVNTKRVSVLISSSAQIGIEGAGLASGSEVAVFTDNGVCVGAGVWENSLLEIMASADNTATPEKDGLVTGDKFLFRIWDKTGNKVYTEADVKVTFSSDPSGNGTYKYTTSPYIVSKLLIMQNGQTLAFSSTPPTTAKEGSAYTYEVVTSGTSGTILNLTAPTLPAWLTFTNTGNGTGRITGTPGDAQEGNHSVLLRVSDGASTVEQSFTLVVSNAAPSVTLTGTFSGTVNSALSFNATASDPGNDAITFSWNWGDGTAAQTGAGPKTHAWTTAGKYNVTVTATDVDGGASTDTREVTIGALNSPPIFTSNPNISVIEGSPYAYAVTTSDGDNDLRSITAVLKPAWLTLTDNGNGTASLSGTPNGTQKGTHNVTLRVTDSRSATSEQSFTITVNNAAPVITAFTGTFAGLVNTTLAFTGTALDPGGDNVTYTWNWGDGTAEQSGVNLTNVSHAYATAGVYTLRLTVSDPSGASAYQTKSVTISGNTNTAPQFSSTPVTAATEGSNYVYTVVTSDPDANTTLTLTAITKPSWLALSATGNGTATLSGTPTDANEGANMVVLEVSDGTATTRQTFEVIVSNAPPRILSFAGTFSGNAGQTLSYSANASDPGNDALTYRWEWGDGTAAQSAINLKEINHTFSVPGTYTIKLTVTDADGAAIFETRTVTIGADNAPPVFTSTPVTTVQEGSRYIYNITTSDGNGDVRTIVVLQKPSWMSFVDNGDGTATLSGNPSDPEEGQYNLTLEVTDTKSAKNQQQFSVNVTNGLPVITNFTGQFTGSVGNFLSFQVVATDPGNDELTYSWNWGDGTPTQTGDLSTASHRWTTSGSYTISVTVSDPDGGKNTVSRPVVIGISNPPSFNTTPITTATEGSLYSYNITTAGGNGNPISIAALTKPTWLTLTPTSNGQATLSGTPFDANEGVNNVVLEASDGTNVTKQIFAINVVNAVPVITNITGDFSGEAGRALSFTGAATDPGNDPLTFSWNFGDGTSAQQGSSVNHTYANAGTYTLVLTVTDTDNGATTALRTVNIQAIAQRSDLAISKTVNVAQPEPGNAVSYTLTVLNNGPDTATNVQVQDLLPAGVLYQLHTSGKTYNKDNGIWYVGTLTNGASSSLTITVQVDSKATGAPITNTASIYQSDQVDGNVVNNNAAVTITPNVTPQNVDVSLSATVSSTNVRPNDTVTQTLNVTNNGPVAAQNLTVTVILPSDLRYQGLTSNGNWALIAQPGIGVSGGSLQLGTPSLAVGATVSFQITTVVSNNAIPGTTLSVVSGLSLANPDNNPLNNNNTVMLKVGNAPVPCDLRLTQVNNNPFPKIGDYVDFTIAVTNSSVLTQSNVRVSEVLPSSLSFVSTLAATSGSYNTFTGVWTVGSLAPAASATLSIRTRVLSLANPIEVRSSATTDEGCTALSSSTLGLQESSSGLYGGVESQASLNIGTEWFSEMLQPASNALSQMFASDYSFAPGTAAVSSIQAALPAYLPVYGPNSTTSAVVSPTWITQNGVTNARDVYSLDYLTSDQRRLGVVLVADSGTDLFDQTKFVCDRLAGGVLSDVQLVQVNNLPFVMGKITHPDGKVDYSILFVAFESATGTSVDSRFTRMEYYIPSGTSRVLNFQVWGATPATAIALAQEVLARIGQQASKVTYLNSGISVPSVYIRSAKYVNGELVLDVANTAGATQMTLQTRYRDTETRAVTQWLSKQLAISLNPLAQTQIVRVASGPFFDMSFSVNGNTGVGRDEVYVTDGQWSAYHPKGAATNFTVSPQSAISPETGVLYLERSASISGFTPGTTSDDWVSLFRYTRAGRKPLDLTQQRFQTLNFTAWGKGSYQVEFYKTSMQNDWDQFRTLPFALSASAQTISIELSKLFRQGGGVFVGNDVDLIVFRVLGDKQTAQSFSLNIQNLRFAGGGIVPVEEDAPLPQTILLEHNYPNPFNPSTTIRYALPETGKVSLRVYNLLGQEVARLVDGVQTAGTHEVRFEAAHLPSGVYVYRLEGMGTAVAKKMLLVK